MGLFYLMAKPFSYGKKEKLKSRKLTDQLFATGNSFTIFPLKLFYLQPSQILDFPVKAGIGVSKKYFKKAVRRNHIKRLLREVYRAEKKALYHFVEAENKQVILFILYIDKTLPDINQVKNKMPFVLSKLIKQLHETIASNT